MCTTSGGSDGSGGSGSRLRACPRAQDPDRTARNGAIDLVRLVDLCGERLDLNLEYDPSILQGSVTLRLGEPVSNEP